MNAPDLEIHVTTRTKDGERRLSYCLDYAEGKGKDYERHIDGEPFRLCQFTIDLSQEDTPIKLRLETNDEPRLIIPSNSCRRPLKDSSPIKPLVEASGTN